MTRWLDDDQQRTWRAWLDANARLATRIHKDLQATSGLSLADYEVLVALTDVPSRRLRMFELGEKLQWEKSRLSKHISRMAARGLVARVECEDDRRGADIELTDQGLAAIEQAAPAHVDLVRELVFDGLSDEQVRALGEFFTTVLERSSATAART